MGINRMDHFISIGRYKNIIDSKGFNSPVFETLAKTRSFREGRHGSERWRNLASFSEATDLYRFRVIPNLEIKNDMVIKEGSSYFEITSVENIKGRNMYIEVLVKEVKPSGQS